LTLGRDVQHEEELVDAGREVPGGGEGALLVVRERPGRVAPEETVWQPGQVSCFGRGGSVGGVRTAGSGRPSNLVPFKVVPVTSWEVWLPCAGFHSPVSENLMRTTGVPAGKSSVFEPGSVHRQPCFALNVRPGKTWTYTVSTMPSAAGVAPLDGFGVGSAGATVVNESFRVGAAPTQPANNRQGRSAISAISFLFIVIHLGFVCALH
jgi:hypothetical protein